MDVATRPSRAHLHVLISGELMQFLKDTVYQRSRAGERLSQQDLVNEILEAYYKEHAPGVAAEMKHPSHTAGCNSSV